MFPFAASNLVVAVLISTVITAKIPIDYGLLQLNPVNNGTNPQVPSAYLPIPLLSVEVKAKVTHAVAEVEVTQMYRNLEEVPIEAIYHFPVNPEGAVSGFWADVDGRIIKGVVTTKEKAWKEYNEAIWNRTTAFLGEEVKPDIFKLRVGFLRPGSQAKIVFSYVTEVKNEPGTNHLRFYIPTTVAPRYVSLSETDEAAQDLRNMTFSSTSPAPLKLDVAVVLLGEIQSITSPTHNVTVEMIRLDTRNGTLHAASVELEGVTTDMDRDFVLNIVPAEVHLPRLYSEFSEQKDENGTTAVMVHFIPYFNISAQKSEFIFVLDRSGSMSGRSIELARQAMKVFLHSLPTDCYFNIIGFGSSFQFLFPTSMKYSEATLQEAIEHAKSLEADLGGTEILQPLQAIYAKSGVEGYSRQIFLITDGQVSNTERVLGTIRENAETARVFALGIGDGASHHLVEGAAKAGGGTSAFVTNNEALDAKVVNQLKNSQSLTLSGIKLKWEFPLGSSSSTEEDVKWKQSPKNIPPIFSGSQLLIFGLFEKGMTPKSVTIRAQSPNGPVTFKLDHSEANEMERGLGMLHRMAAVKLIRELELEVNALGQGLFSESTKEEKELKKEIKELSIQNGVTSKYTAFVAVDIDRNHSTTSSNETFVMMTRKVPNQIPNGWHGKARGKPISASRSHVRNRARFPRPPARISRKKSRVSPQPGSRQKEDATSPRQRPSQDSRLMELIQAQTFDGSFVIDERLAKIVGLTTDELRNQASRLNFSEKAFATALAVYEFTTRFKGDKGTWELIVRKARDWLATEVEDVNKAIEQVSNFRG